MESIKQCNDLKGRWTLSIKFGCGILELISSVTHMMKPVVKREQVFMMTPMASLQQECVGVTKCRLQSEKKSVTSEMKKCHIEDD